MAINSTKDGAVEWSTQVSKNILVYSHIITLHNCNYGIHRSMHYVTFGNLHFCLCYPQFNQEAARKAGQL